MNKILSYLFMTLIAVSSMAGVYDVTNYGAYPNDDTDDLAAILSALKDVPKTGGTLLFPKGQYIVRSKQELYIRISKYSNLTITGEGRDESIIAFDNMGNTSGIGIYVEYSPGFTIKNIHLTSLSKVPNAKLGDNMPYGLFIRGGCPGSRVLDMEVSWFTGSGIVVRPSPGFRSDNILIENCFVHNCNNEYADGNSGSRGILISSQVDTAPDDYIRDVTIRGCHFWDNGSENSNYTMAVYAGFVSGFIFENNVISGRPSGGEHQFPGFSFYPEGSGVIIRNNTVSNTWVAIHTAAIVMNNRFLNCRNFSPRGTNSKYINNTFTMKGGNGIPYLVNFGDDHPDITFDGNIFVCSFGATGNAIRSTGSSRLNIINNTFIDFTAALLFKNNDGGGHNISNNVFQSDRGVGLHINLPFWPSVNVTFNHFYGTRPAYEDFTKIPPNYQGNRKNGSLID